MTRVSVDRMECISTGNCVATYPEIFGFDVDGLAVALVDDVDVAPDEAIEVVSICPVGAITVHENTDKMPHLQ